MKTRTSHIIQALALGALTCGALLGQSAVAQNKQLILQTQPEPTVIELQGNMQIDGNGNINVIPVDPEACTATGDCEGVDVAVNSFTVNGQTSNVEVAQGETLRMRWESRGAWACDGSGLAGWTATGKQPNNTVGQVVSTTSIDPGPYTVGLSCYNGTIVAGTTPTVDIDVTDEEPTDPPVPAGCEDRVLPSTWSRMTTGSNSCSYNFGSAGQSLDTDADCRQFTGVWPFDWEDQASLQRVMGIPTSNQGRHYISLQFNSGVVPTSGSKQISINQPQTAGLDNRQKLITISKCPGDFDQAAIASEMGSGCMWQTFTDNILWSGPQAKTHPFICGLDANTNYYMNIIFTDSEPGTAPQNIQPNTDCASGFGCGSRFTPSG